MDGTYGMTQHAIAIEINSFDYGELLKSSLMSDKFQQVLKSCIWGNFQIDWKLFPLLKKDFYNYL